MYVHGQGERSVGFRKGKYIVPVRFADGSLMTKSLPEIGV